MRKLRCAVRVRSNADESAHDPRSSYGTISAETAFFGLTIDELHLLNQRHSHAEVLVRLRGTAGDTRCTMHISDLFEWHRLQMPFLANDLWWSYQDIRDVLPIATN